MSESNLIVSHLTFHEPPPSFQFWGEGSRLLLTIRASGELVFAPDARPEEAVRVLMDAWSRMLPQSALRTAVTAERQRLRGLVEGFACKDGEWLLRSSVLALLAPEKP